jgi:hypothetical protein
MYISKNNRLLIRNMYEGKCAYTGTDLLPDWQIDHIEPVRRNWWENSALKECNHTVSNMLPSQKIINHYKHSMNLEQFREFMMEFHIRLKRLPKNPKVQKSIKRKAYMLEIARLFDITPNKPFIGKFWFERL